MKKLGMNVVLLNITTFIMWISSIIIDLYLYDEYGYLCELTYCFFICNTNFPSYKKILIPHDESEMSDIALN